MGAEGRYGMLSRHCQNAVGMLWAPRNLKLDPIFNTLWAPRVAVGRCGDAVGMLWADSKLLKRPSS
jgi:hypothetical protein